MTRSDTCPNCGAGLGSRYCPACGQDNSRVRLETRAVLADAFQNLVGWDSALGHTLRGLFTDPGAMAADYVGGRRRRYVNPARFCLLSLALWFFLARLLGLDPMDLSGFKVTTSTPGEEAARFGANLKAFFQRNFDVLLYLSLPLRALLLGRFFRGSGRNVAECLVLTLYVESFAYLLGVLIVPLALAGQDWSLTARKLVALVWSIHAARAFFGRGLFATSWRMLIVTGLHMVLTVLLFLAIAMPWIMLTS